MMTLIGIAVVTGVYVMYSLCKENNAEKEYKRAKERLEVLETEWNYLYNDYENGVYENNEIEYDIQITQIEYDMCKMKEIIEKYEGK